MLLAAGTGHEIGHLAARSEDVLLDRRRVAGRAPPSLELAWIRPQVPDPFDRFLEVGDQGDGEVVVVRGDADDGHSVPPSASTSDMRSTRPRHVASSASRASRARVTAAGFVWT